LHPPISLYVTSGFSSTVIIVTDGSIFGGRGIYIEYFAPSTPTLIPSSISVGDTFYPNPTTYFAIYFMLIKYFALGVRGLRILVHLATYKGYSFNN